jgi:hypothetical protein
MQRHNINATDAALLTTLLEFAQALEAPACVLVSSDRRLLREAEAEGFPTVDPAALPAPDVAVFLATL